MFFGTLSSKRKKEYYKPNNILYLKGRYCLRNLFLRISPKSAKINSAKMT